MSNNGRLVGKWVRFVADRGFGFIHADGKDYFLHESNLLDPEALSMLSVGDQVSFVPHDTPKGLRAEDAKREVEVGNRKGGPRV